MQFLTPIAFAGALLAIPVVLLYMLRLRRRDVTVSSTMLWQQVVRDSEANTPWQRLRRNLLLFLQLIILAALVLALARPFQIVPTVGAGRVALLLDASASMSATDSADGTRFNEAKRIANQIVDQLNPTDVMTIIRVGDTPDVLAPYSGDAATLHTAIDAALPGLGEADWNSALTLAAAGAGGASNFDVLLVSDGGGMLRGGDGQPTLPAIPGNLRYVSVGSDASNVAITALAVSAQAGGSSQLFAQIENYGAQDATVVVDLRIDDELTDAQNMTIPAGGSLPLITEALPSTFTTARVGLTLPSDSTVVDHLAADNAAWAVNSGQGARRVLLMTEGNLFLEQGLRSLPGLTVTVGDPVRGLPAQPYDLYVFDDYTPPTLPQGDLLFINPPDSTPLFAVGAESTQATNPRVRRDDPRMTYVDFANINILKFKQVVASWADTLITVDGGPLLLAGETNNRQVAILTFDLRDSDLPLQIPFLILLSSLADWFTPQSVVNVTDSVHVDAPVTLTPGTNADGVRVTLPDGGIRNLTPTGLPLIFAETGTPGIYTVDALHGEEIDQTASFAVNLFAPGESDITPAANITLGSIVVTQAVEVEFGQREYWDVLALAALAILLIEWYAYHQRLRAPTIGASLMRRPARST